MREFMEQIQNNYKHMVNMSLFNKFKTNDPIVDALLSTFILSFIGYFFTYIYENYIDRYFLSLTYDDVINYFYNKNEIIIEGKRSTSITAYSSHLNTSSMYSDRFKAIWNYIIENIENNKTIYCIKETHSNFQSSSGSYDDKRKNLDIFMVSQYKHFSIDPDIYVKATIEEEESRDKDEKINSINSSNNLSDKFKADLRNSVPNFTQRQLEILQALIEGKTNYDIASELGYSVSTIRQETIKIYSILNVSGRRAAAQEALRQQIV